MATGGSTATETPGLGITMMTEGKRGVNLKEILGVTPMISMINTVGMDTVGQRG